MKKTMRQRLQRATYAALATTGLATVMAASICFPLLAKADGDPNAKATGPGVKSMSRVTTDVVVDYSALDSLSRSARLPLLIPQSRRDLDDTQVVLHPPRGIAPTLIPPRGLDAKQTKTATIKLRPPAGMMASMPKDEPAPPAPMRTAKAEEPTARIVKPPKAPEAAKEIPKAPPPKAEAPKTAPVVKTETLPPAKAAPKPAPTVKAEAPKMEPPKVEAPKPAAPKVEAPKVVEAPKPAPAAKAEAPKVAEAPKPAPAVKAEMAPPAPVKTPAVVAAAPAPAPKPAVITPPPVAKAPEAVAAAPAPKPAVVAPTPAPAPIAAASPNAPRSLLPAPTEAKPEAKPETKVAAVPPPAKPAEPAKAEEPKTEAPKAEAPKADALPDAESAAPKAEDEKPVETKTAALPPANKAIPDTITISFEVGVPEVPDSAIDDLKGLATRMKADENLRVQLLAFASDPEKSVSRSRRLSLERAVNVRRQLLTAGIDSTRIEVRALGEQSGDGAPDRVDAITSRR